MRFISLSTILVCNEYLAKIYNLLNHHGKGPMQPQRLHWLKADPDHLLLLTSGIPQFRWFAVADPGAEVVWGNFIPQNACGAL